MATSIILRWMGGILLLGRLLHRLPLPSATVTAIRSKYPRVMEGQASHFQTSAFDCGYSASRPLALPTDNRGLMSHTLNSRRTLLGAACLFALQVAPASA